jgi:hypothetical protein
VDEALERYVRELIAAVNAAVTRDPDVQACRERARADGFELKVSLAAEVGIVGVTDPAGRASVAAAQPPSRRPPAGRPYEITAADRRFLRSLRIAPTDTSDDI